MPVDPASIDVARDVAFLPDIKGPALMVQWRRIPAGFIRPLNRVPKLPAGASAELKAELRAEYKKHIGKWYSALLGGDYFDTKEEAARYVIARTIDAASESPLIQAALREDYTEVERLMIQETRSRITPE
jgi:hypothetical protein